MQDPLYYVKNKDKLVCAMLINMDKDGKITDEQYNKYFKSNNSVEGVKQVIKNNQFFINGFPIPGTKEEFEKKTPDGYLINKKKWLTFSNGKYKVMQSKKDFDTYDEASFATATGFVAGLEVRLFDLDGDSYVDYIEVDYVESIIVNEIILNKDNTFSLYRSDVDEESVWEYDGKRFDGDVFTKSWKEKIEKKNFDSSIKPGNMCLFMYRPDGWVVQRAKEVKGKFINGEDHKFYQIGEKQFQDAMRFSRDNIIISNRCGEYLNTHKYFGLLNMKDDSEVSLWFIHSTDKNRYGAPCGFTSGRFGRYFLLKAIECCKKKLDSIIVDENGKNLQKGQKYVNRINHERFKNLIMRAEKICDTRYPIEIHDYNTYLLYFANAGSQNDIGAKFAGFNYEGFDNQIKIK